MARPNSRSRAPLSLEASLDEDNREVLAASDTRRTSSPGLRPIRTATPPPPNRSVLGLPSPPTSRHGSIAGIGVGVTSPRQDRKKSKLDPSDPSTWTSARSSKPNSPVLTRADPVSTRQNNDSSPDAGAGYVGRTRTDRLESLGSEGSYDANFGSQAADGNGSTKSPMNAHRPRGSSAAMAAAMSGDFSSLYVGMPASDASAQSVAIGGSQHTRNTSSGSQAVLSPITTISPPPAVEEAGIGRLPTDNPATEQALQESSDEDPNSDDSDNDERGRDRSRTSDSDTASAGQSSLEDQRSPTSDTEPPPKAPTIHSLLEPSISVTNPAGQKTQQTTVGASGPDLRRVSGSVVSADGDSDEDAIAKAKTLGLNISPLDTHVTDRHVRMIIRGDWFSFNKQDSDARVTKTFLCCSDLSNEANYALEWTVGTILRDGDTLLAIYAIEDENAESRTRNDKVTEAERQVLQQEGAKAGKDASDAMQELTQITSNSEGTTTAAMNYTPATELQSLTGSVDARSVGKKELERLKAIDHITQTFLKFVRKTTLQVRCMVEVMHCKSPKHLLLGAVSQPRSLWMTHC